MPLLRTTLENINTKIVILEHKKDYPLDILERTLKVEELIYQFSLILSEINENLVQTLTVKVVSCKNA